MRRGRAGFSEAANEGRQQEKLREHARKPSPRPRFIDQAEQADEAPAGLGWQTDGFYHHPQNVGSANEWSHRSLMEN
jgi:hypothetical protein